MRTVMTLLVAAALAAAGPKPGEKGTPEFEKAAELVKQLGHPRFAAREAAAKELTEMGGAAVPALTAGTKSEDAEVRTRCTALVPKAKAVEWNRRADAYLAKPDGKHDLPLSAEWDKLVGKPDAGSRKLYADMLRTSGEFLERAAGKKSPADTAEQCRQIIQRMQAPTGLAKAAVGELAAVVFADTFNPEFGHRRTTDVPMDVILANPTWEEAFGAADLGPPVRKLLARWAEAGGPSDVNVFLQFADLVRHKPFPEAAPVLIKTANDKKADALQYRLIAVDALGKVGGNDATAALAALIGDKTELSNGGRHQLGDAALAALIQMRGKMPTDYGIDNDFEMAFGTRTPGKAIPLTLYGFHTAGERAKAIEKWKAESAKKDQ